MSETNAPATTQTNAAATSALATQSEASTTPQAQAPEQGQPAPASESQVREMMARLAQREKQLQRAERERAERDRQMAEELASYRRRFQTLKEKPIDFLNEQGLSAERLLEEYAGQGKPDPVKELERKIAALEAERQAERERAEGLEKQATVDKAVGAVRKMLEATPDKHELILQFGFERQVYEAAEKEFQETGVEPDLQEIAARFESALEAEQEKAFKTRKGRTLAERLYAQEFAKPQTPEQAPKTQAAPTLNQTTTARTEPSGKLLSREESLRQAAAALRFR